MLSFLDKIPFLDSILLDFELGIPFISLLGLKKFLFELFATFELGLIFNVKPSKYEC